MSAKRAHGLAVVDQATPRTYLDGYPFAAVGFLSAQSADQLRSDHGS